MPVKIVASAWVAALLVSGSAYGQATGQEHQTRIRCQSGAELSTALTLKHDIAARQMHVLLERRAENAKAIKAQEEVAKSMKAFLASLPKGVKARSSGYSARKQHLKNKPDAWVVAERVTLSGGGKAKLLTAVDRASSHKIVVKTFQYVAGKKERAKAEARLEKRAARRWHKKMTRMAESLGCNAVTIKKMSVQNHRTGPVRPIRYRALKTRSGAHSEIAPAPGRQTIRVTVRGTGRAANIGHDPTLGNAVKKKAAKQQ